jgi:hypothetical protein
MMHGQRNIKKRKILSKTTIGNYSSSPSFYKRNRIKNAIEDIYVILVTKCILKFIFYAKFNELDRKYEQ